jgi:hypothetical protein
MKKMESKYAGKCRACGVRFPAGTLIEYDRRGARGRKAQHVDCENPLSGPPLALEEGAPGHGPGCYGECDGLYDCSAPAPAPASYQTVSYEVRTSGGTFYQNRGGRCEDAPCCGCCTF